MVKNRAKIEQLNDALVESVLSGQRIYYPEPTIEYDSSIGCNVCTLFKIKAPVEGQLFDEMREYEFGYVKDAAKKYPTEMFADRLVNKINDTTWNDANHPLSFRIRNKWPAAPFEQWMEETHKRHWMTAKWFKAYTELSYYDYAFLITVKSIVPGDVEKYNNDYGSAFVLTKLMYQ